MLRVLPIVVYLGFIVFCLIDCIQTPPEQIRNLPKAAWVILILLFEVIGCVAWLVAGRPQGARRGRSTPWPATGPAGLPEHPGPRSTLAPDDDPAFLRQLKDSNDDHERMLKRWEDDLRRREGEMRDGSDDATDGGEGTPPRA